MRVRMQRMDLLRKKTRTRTLPLLFVLSIPCALKAQQGGTEKKELEAAPPSATTLQREAPYGYLAPAKDAYQGAWNSAEARDAASLWKALCEARPADVNAQFNWFRSERNARLSANNGILSSTDKEELHSIADRINTIAPGSFEQNLSAYYMAGPTREAFTALYKALEQQPARPELILPMIQRANMDGDKPGLDQWCLRLEKEGGLAPSLNDVATDLLLSVSPGGVVFVNGDLDGAPALVRQRLHDERRDVLIIDQRLLNDAAYRQRIWQEAQAAGPVPGPGPEYAVKLASSTARGIFLALSLDRSWFDAFNERLCPVGIAFRVGGTGPCPTATLAEHWAAMRKPLSAGPLSRNYLLPGAVLLQRYRSEPQSEGRAAMLEHELREMAARSGATQELIKAGVFLH